jgi:tetratricopeptide (TPR) repeat protein
VTATFVRFPAVDDEDPGALARLQAEVGAVLDLVTSLGGDVLQCTGGDKGLMLYAVFGTPVAHPDDALRAVTAMGRVGGVVDGSVEIGVATGLAFVGTMGGRSRQFISAIGDTVNLAARMMSTAGPGGIVVEANTLAAAGPASLDHEPPALVAVKGKADPIEASRVRGVRSAGPPIESSGATSLVGRTDELARIEAKVDRLVAEDGGGGAVLLVGDAGVGTSAVAREAVRRARLRGIDTWSATVDRFGLGEPFGPFVGLVRKRLGVDADADADVAADVAAVVESVRRNHPDQEAFAPLVASVLGLDTAESDATAALSPADRADVTVHLVAEIVIRGADPLVVRLDDIHHSDEATLRLLAEIEPRLAGSRVLLITTGRVEGLGDAVHVDVIGGVPGERITVGPLAPSDVATFVVDTWQRMGAGALPAPYLEQLVDRAGGNPAIATTLTGFVRREWIPGRPLPDLPLPDELLPMVVSRLDPLDDDLQRTALHCALIGRPTTSVETAAITGRSAADVDDDLSRLVDLGIARQVSGSGERAVVLQSSAMAEALLQRTTHGDRAPLHERIALALIDADGSPREIAGHLEHCDRPELLRVWSEVARDEAMEVWALREARRWGVAAVELADEDHRGSALLQLARVEVFLGELAAAEARLTSGWQWPSIDGRRHSLLGKIAFETGRLEEAVDLLERAEAMGESGAEVTWPLTMALTDLGRFAEARGRAERQLASSTDPHSRMDAAANLGAAAAQQGDFDAAAVALIDARRLAESLDDRMRLVHVIGDLAGVTFESGRAAESIALLDEATTLAHRLGARRTVAMMLGNTAFVRLAAGDTAGAARSAAAAVRAAASIDNISMATDFLEPAILGFEVEGDATHAVDWWQRHARLASAVGKPHDAAISWLRAAALLADAGDESDARACVRRAEELAGDEGVLDIADHFERVADALAGTRRPPLEVSGVSAAVDLPALDASMPEVDVEAVDLLLVDLTARAMRSPSAVAAS